MLPLFLSGLAHLEQSGSRVLFKVEKKKIIHILTHTHTHTHSRPIRATLIQKKGSI